MKSVPSTDARKFSTRNRRVSRLLAVFLIVCLLLSQSGGILTAHADVLSGADSATLVRAPQLTPDGLGASGLTGLQYADPSAAIDLVQPPVANNQGDAEVTQPLSVPPGRNGIQPDLALSYSSSGGNGWTGLGWDLSVGSVIVDTRWGVPRYDPANETETYVLDGDVLAPTAVRSTFVARTVEKVFTRRTEGKYERIVRHGSGPGSYWWEITDKSGTRRYYGGTPEGGRDPAAILADDSGHEYRWGLKQVRDISNNTMTFSYDTVQGTAVGANNSALGREMYLSSIVYNGSVAPGVPDDPAYKVVFVRASQLGEPTRPDVSIDGRGGFLRVTADLLRHVDIYYRNTLAKRFVLDYSQRAFAKTLLADVVQAGADGVEYARHTFDYYNDVGYNGSSYQGFAPSTTWNTGSDGVGNTLDLGAFGKGNASALGGSQSIGADGHAYIGFNFDAGEKEGSFGGSVVFKGEDNKSLLEMIDINGDNLPDKVFLDASGLSYRLNTSGPDGTTTFGPVRPIVGIGTLSHESNFGFGFGPEAHFGVEALYNHEWNWTWGRTYFADVNQDGLNDLVDDGTVYFNHLDANGNPVFTTDSSTTGVPIDAGTVDPSVVPNLSAIADQQRAAAPLQDTLRRWQAPWTGQISIQGDVTLQAPPSGKAAGDGVRVAIQHGGSELWSALIDGTDYTPKTPTGVATIDVTQGDFIYFRVGSRDDGAVDQVSWDPVITYLNVTSTQDANGLDVYRYQGSTDFTLAGLNNMFVVAPLDGAVHLAGDFVKLHKTSDDISVQVLVNGTTAAAPVAISGAATGTIPLALDLNVKAQDHVLVLAKIDSPVDLAAFTWNPRLYYTSATQNGQPVTVTSTDGKPLLDLQAPANIQIYPRTDLTAPQTTWTAPSGNAITAKASVSFSSNTQSGTVVVTVKKKITPAAASDAPSVLVAKQTLTITNGTIAGASPASLTFTPDNGAQYWFDMSVAQPALGSQWTSGQINISSDPSNPVYVPAARHWTYVPEQVFPPAYRGWAYAGYNAADGRETQPIDESRLVFDKNDYPQAAPQLTSNTQYPTQSDVDPNYKNPVDGKAYFYAPFTVVDATTGAVVDRQWRGSKANIFGSAGQAGSSRLGPDSIGLPSASQLAGAHGVTRFSMTSQDAIAGGLGGLIGGSYAWGNSQGYMDFLDMNGDGFPDIVGSGSIQYTDPRGGLESAARSVPQLSGSVRLDSSTTKTLDGGGTAAEIKADARGKSNTSQAATASSGNSSGLKAIAPSSGNGTKALTAAGSGSQALVAADGANASKALVAAGGASGSKALVASGTSSSQAVVTTSGDANGSTALAAAGGSHQGAKSSTTGTGNTGHAEPGEDSQTGVSLGLSGGLGWSSTGTPADAPPTDDVLQTDLADLNGDGLPDRVTVHRNGTMTVAFNLGYGFSQEVVWPGGSFQQGYSTSQSIGPTLGFSTGDLAFAGGVSLSGATDEQKVTWVDLNGDGLADQLRVSNGQVLVRFNTGAGLTGDVNWGTFRDNAIARSKSVSLGGGVDFTIGIGPLCEIGCYLIINPGVHVEGGISRPELQLADVNGDGYPDDIASTSDGSMDVSLNTTGRTNLLKSVANPLGGTIALDYTRKGNTTSEAFSQWVLSRVAVNDGRPGDGTDVQLTTYEYANNVYNPLERSFLGYANVIERQRDASQPGEPILRSYVRVYRNATIFDSGLLASETLTGPGDTPLKATVNSYNLVDASTGAPVNLSPDPAGVGLLGLAVFPQLVKTENDFYNGNAVAKRTWNTFAYDTLGNITETVDVGEPDLPGDDVIADTTYSDCRTSSWVSLPQTFVVHDANGKVLRHRWADNQLCTNGAVTTLYEDTGSGIAQTNLAFDAWGNYNQIIYPPNTKGERYEVDYVYDADRHTNIAQTTDSYGLVGLATFDGPTGLIASQIDANNQLTTYTYDAQGRLATITGPFEQGTGHATISFEYFPTAPAYAYALAHHYDAFHPNDTIDTARFIDGIGRETQTKQDAAVFRGAGQAAQNEMVVSGAAAYDALGRAVKEWYPVEEPLGTIGTFNTIVDSVSPTQYTWTLLDQLAQVIAPDGSVTATTYGFDNGSQFGTTMFLNTRTDPLGNVRRSYSDIRDNLLAEEADHKTGTTVQTLRTSYIYDPLQELTQVVDPGGNKITHEYDLLGRQTASTTPDGGRGELQYDLASNLTARVTPVLRAAKGQVSYSYDFNRLTGVIYSDGTPPVSYTYGALGAPGNGAGRVVQESDGARVQTRTYDPIGAVNQETTTMLVHNLTLTTTLKLTWTTATNFDTWGRPKTVTYPDGEVVSYGYDSGGLLSTMAGNKDGTVYPYILRQEYDKFLKRRYQVTGNNVAQELQYDPATLRLAHLITNAPNRTVQNLTYTYDLVGNVLTANNAAPVPVTSLMGGTSQQTYVYDDLYQLTGATGTYVFAPGKHRDYTYSLTYDNLGNIVNKAQTDTIFNNPKGTPQAPTTYSLAYAYKAAPHQATHIGGKTYTYDADGNLTGWTNDANGQNRTVTWDAEDRATSVADQGSTTTYTYDESDQLAIQRGPQGETAFVNRYYTVRNGSVFWKNYWAGPERIATKMQMPAGQPETMEYFLHKDLEGSTNFITDPTGNIFEYLLYFPGGEQWVFEHNDIYRTPNLYTGGYLDDFRTLYNFGSRWYTPQEQLMYSPDPALTQDPPAAIDDPALLSAYSYAENNPVRLVDASGHASRDPQAAFRIEFLRPDGTLDLSKAANLNAWVQRQVAAELAASGPITRLIGELAAGTQRLTAAKAFKAFATFKAQPLLQINLTPTDDGLKLKNIKIAPFFFKQFTVKEGKP